MKTKKTKLASGTSVEIFVWNRKVNVQIIPINQWQILPTTITLADIVNVFELVQSDFPWLTNNQAIVTTPNGEFGSRLGFVFMIPEDLSIPEFYLEND